MPTQHQPIWNFLQKELNIHSKNALYIEAFTQRHDVTGTNNQRLAFLGDRVISLVIRNYYFQKDPHGDKGDLTEASVDMEKEEYLAEKSVTLGISSLMIGPNIPEGKGRPQAEVLEALFGAIYLDQGFDRAREIAEKFLF
jgi:ribonuclease III